MNADGTGQTNITRSAIGEGAPDWQPIRSGARPPAPTDPRRCVPSIVGKRGNDRLVGTEGDDFMYGLTGKDRLHGRGGRDVLDGGPGNDALFARDRARDHVFCGPGNDRAVVDSRDLVARCERVTRS